MNFNKYQETIINILLLKLKLKEIFVKKKLIISILILLSGIAIIILNVILKSFDWHLRKWILNLSAILVLLGISLLGIFYRNTVFIKTIKNKVLKIFAQIIWIIVTIIACYIIFSITNLGTKNDIIKIIDDKQYIGIEYYTIRLRKTVYYYEKYNAFAYHKSKEYIKEFYDNDDYEHPKSRVYYKIPQTDSKIYYYDENGNITEIKNR